MHLKTRSWFLVSLLCFLAAGFFWHLGNERYRRDAEAAARATNTEPATPIKELGANNFHHSPPPIASPSPQTNVTNTARSNPLLTNRLSNTSKTIKELMRNDRAVLLRNAFIDTGLSTPLDIPPHLRSQAAPGSYVVQSRTLLNNAFRARLQSAGATIISYIPNNAYLVRASEDAANRLRSLPQTQSVLPWEPYYKLDLPLLALAVQNQSLPTDTKLNVLVFPGERDNGRKSLEELGAKILGEDRSPFGHQLVIQAPPDILPALAGLPLVQSVEIHHARQLVNDLSRPRVGVTTNSYSPPPNYLDLTGEGVIVNVNDSGIFAAHPDFDTRVTGDTIAATLDYDGHGTHVAGIIAGSGSMSSSVTKHPQGSATNGWDFRGMAHKAKLFAAQIDLITGPVISDTYLQETAARTNAFISNNSWGYIDSFDYDSSSASFDEAARNAIPGQPGSESLLFVFAAGNSGEGGADGQGGQPESINSPGTAKNVITVGAIEKPRGITNLVIGTDGKTNMPFYPRTDSDNQVTYFSSRGNVGVGVEGDAGRFKPDVVAPGEFVISCRSDQWKDPTASGGVILNRIKGEVVKPAKTNAYDILIPGNAISLTIIARSNLFSPNPFPNLPLYAKAGSPPDLTNDFVGNGSVNIPVTPGQWFFAVGNSTAAPVSYDLITIIFLQNTNSGNYFLVLSNLNSELAPWYRYESGTSQAAPAVSGILALMQQFFEQRLNLTNHDNWPALMKGMLINGSRSMSAYSRQVDTGLNLQGWGVVNLTNTLPPAMNGGIAAKATWPIAFFHTNSLYTGQSHTRTIGLAPFARTAPLRVTLVWTDPPGNPAASLKLVNDLDLIVSNNIPDGEVYFGNNIPEGSDFNSVIDPTDTNTPAVYDLVNNVENVFINRPIPGTNFSVTVRAHRVNVNAVTGQTNGILQDYALVISSGNTLLTNAFTVSDISVVPQSPDFNAPFVKALSNGVPLIHERVGANNPEVEVLNNGVINQWNFYVYTNTTTFTNVAFVTFLSPNLSRSRFRDADIDLYVSPNPALTNLDTNVISDAIVSGPFGGRSSRGRSGTEVIVYTNAGPNSIFYIGVKAEDQQAAEFDLLGIAFNDSGRDANGNIRLIFNPVPAEIPDGSPEAPKAVTMLAFVMDPANVRRIIITNVITHENMGDLYGILTRASPASTHSVVLNNHRSTNGTVQYIYDDSTEADINGTQITDGPGRLRDFIGEPAALLWQFTMIDNSPYHTGRVDSLIGYIEPDDQTNAAGTLLTVCGHKWKYSAVDVPFGVTNMIVSITNQNPALPLDVYLRLGDFPDLLNYDAFAQIDPPGGSLSLSVNDSPGLQPGNRYYIGIYNPDPVQCVQVRLLPTQFQYSLAPIASTRLTSSDTPKVLADDAVTNSFIVVTNARIVSDVKVGVRIDHPRISDLVLHLVSPQGKRILLSENRGGPLSTNYGFGFPVSYSIPVSSSGGPSESRTTIDTTNRAGVIRIDYDFFNVPDDLRVYYDGNRIFDSGLISGAGTFSINYGPGISTLITIVMNEGNNANTNTQWQYTAIVTGPWNYATFTDDPNLGGPIKFGLPAYDTIPTNRTVLSNSFEAVGMLTNRTNFAQFAVGANTFEKWVVLTNGVAVFSDTNHPYDLAYLGSTNWGTNFLVLSSGQVGLSLSNIIVPDRDYVLNFVQRKVSSSPTQSVDLAVGASSDIFYQLNVTNELSTDGAESPPLRAGKVRLCPGQAVVITAGSGAQGNTNVLFAGLPLYSLVGCFSLRPEALTSNTVVGAPFYIGTNATIFAPSDPGDYYLFLGVNNNNFDVNPTNMPAGFVGVNAAWQQCQYASGQVLLGANAIPITGSANWKVESQQFFANPTMTNLVLKPDINTTLMFDAFEIDELVSTMYYQSEEPMAPFKGDLALGNWRLEVWDNRSGPVSLSSGGTGNATNDTGTLLSWSLNFIFADGPAAIPLTNGVAYTNTVRRDQIKYFVVAVPNEVTSAKNVVFSTGPGTAGVNLLYSPFGLPTGQSPPDPLPAIPEGLSPLVISNTGPVGAEMPQGRLYYLGVQNIDPAEVNNFYIRVDFNIPVTPLFNGVGQVGTVISNNYPFVMVRDNPSLAVTNMMKYYYFDVLSTDVVSTTFIISNMPSATFLGDVNLVLRRALPVVDLFPHPTFFDYESTQPSFRSEIIIVNSNSLPVKLAPGRWYAGVYNTSFDGPARFSIVAKSDIRPLWNYVDLANGVPTNFSISSFSDRTNFYRFLVDGTNYAGVLFEIYQDSPPNGFVDADLLIKRSDLPAPDLYDFSYLQPIDRTSTFTWLPELTAFRTNILIPDIRATNWFLQILNPGPNGAPISGWVCAKLTDPITGLLYDCQDTTLQVTNTFTPGGPFTFLWNSVPGEKYAVLETSNLRNWTTNKTITATQTKTSFTTPSTHGGPPRFYRIEQVRP